MTEGDTPGASAEARRYYAQSDIVHDDVVIRAGDAIPPGFPVDSLKKLILAKAVGTAPPKPAALTREPGKP